MKGSGFIFLLSVARKIFYKKRLTFPYGYGIIITEREVMSMRKESWIWFDMDGTIADFYGVEGWLDDLKHHNTRPYREAKGLYNNLDLSEVLLLLKNKGYKIGIISWSSKDNCPDFDRAVELAKKEWLYNRLFDVVLDKIIVTPYGVRKADTCRKYGSGILVDDEEQNRTSWDLGKTIDATKNILTALRELLK